MALIGFANGVFDCFHDGHRHFLRECKMNCDELIVMIDADEQVKRLKGPPQQNQSFRLHNVRMDLRQLDLACLFENDEELLKAMIDFKPDVIFKGEDYYGKPITGGHLARIHWVARHPGYSSTIERQKKLYPEPIAVEDM